MPTFQEYVAKVIACFQGAGSWGLSIAELTQIAQELGWPAGTARRRAYYLATLLEATGVIQEASGEAKPSLVSIVAPHLLSLLRDNPKVASEDLDKLAKELAKTYTKPQRPIGSWQQAIAECIEVLEGVNVLQRKEGYIIFNSENSGLLKQDLDQSRIILK